MPEQYQVIFNSRSSNAILDTTLGLNKVSYLTNWGSFLPTKYKRFLCKFILKSENYISSTGDLLTEHGLVNMSMGNTYTFDNSTRSGNVGIINPVVSAFSDTFCISNYNSTNYDNNPFYMDYPLSSSVVVTLNSYDNIPLENMQHYVIILNMVGVSDEDNKNDNIM